MTHRTPNPRPKGGRGWKTRLSRDTLFLGLGLAVFTHQAFFNPTPSEFMIMVALALMGSPIFLRALAATPPADDSPKGR